LGTEFCEVGAGMYSVKARLYKDCGNAAVKYRLYFRIFFVNASRFMQFYTSAGISIDPRGKALLALETFLKIIYLGFSLNVSFGQGRKS